MTIYDGRERFGRFFDDFQPGDVYKHWPGITITEYMNTQFCLLTMNHMPLHIDKHFSAQSQHGQRIVVGTLVFSLAVGMSVPDTSGRTIANLEYEKITHDGPVWIGDSVYAESEVLDKRESSSKPDRGVVHVETRVTNQSGQRVLTFRRRFLAPKRGAPGAA